MQLKHINELLSVAGTGVEGSLLIPKKIYDTLILESAKALIPRSEAGWYIGPSEIPGSTTDVDLETENTLAVHLIAEAGEVSIDQQSYSSTNLKPLKYGVGLRITTELLEDGKWNMLQKNIEIAGRRFAENENRLTVVALDSADNTVSGGAAVTIPNITRAMQYLDDQDKNPSTYIVGMEVLQDLRLIDTFVDFQKSGNTDMLTKGFLGNIFGMNVIKVSTNAGMTTTSSYVFDNRYAYAIAEKRAMTLQNFDLPAYDLSAASLTQRITVKAIRTNAIAKITSS